MTIHHNTSNSAINTPISALKAEYDDALSAMAIADELTLDPAQNAQAEEDLDREADRAMYAVYRTLIRRPKDASEKAIQKDLWETYAEDIVMADESSRLHGLHLKMPLLALAA